MSATRFASGVCVFLLLTACAARPATPISSVTLPTASIVQATTRPGMSASIASAAPSVPLAATSSALLDTPILEAHTAQAQPIPQPTPAPTQQASATPVAHSIQRVVIEDIGLDQQPQPVGLADDGRPIVPQHDIGWYTNSGVPGQHDNVVLWGHALRFLNAPQIPAPFGRLKELQIGAKITLYDDLGLAHVYAVAKQIWAKPSEVEYILPSGNEELTLVSCIGDRVMTARGIDMSHRLITIATPVT